MTQARRDVMNIIGWGSSFEAVRRLEPQVGRYH